MIGTITVLAGIVIDGRVTESAGNVTVSGCAGTVISSSTVIQGDAYIVRKLLCTLGRRDLAQKTSSSNDLTRC